VAARKLVDVDRHDGTFAVVPRHRKGKAMAVVPSSLAGRLLTMHDPRKKPLAQSFRTRARTMPLSADDRRALAMLATSGHDSVAQAWLSAHGPTPA